MLVLIFPPPKYLGAMQEFSSTCDFIPTVPLEFFSFININHLQSTTVTVKYYETIPKRQE